MGKLYEFRDYHFIGDMTEYRAWWERGLTILGSRIDVVGVWFDSGIAPRISGTEPMPMPYGSANVTWVIRWDTIEQRDEVWNALWDDPEWAACAERHPGFDLYKHMSVRFLEQAREPDN